MAEETCPPTIFGWGFDNRPVALYRGHPEGMGRLMGKALGVCPQKPPDRIGGFFCALGIRRHLLVGGVHDE